MIYLRTDDFNADLVMIQTLQEHEGIGSRLHHLNARRLVDLRLCHFLFILDFGKLVDHGNHEFVAVVTGFLHKVVKQMVLINDNESPRGLGQHGPVPVPKFVVRKVQEVLKALILAHDNFSSLSCCFRAANKGDLGRLLNHSGRTIVHCNIHLVRVSPVVGKGVTNGAIAAISPSPSSPPGTSVPGAAR